MSLHRLSRVRRTPSCCGARHRTLIDKALRVLGQLLIVLLLSSPWVAQATQGGTTPPFLEYEAGDEEYFLTIEQAAPVQMAYVCESWPRIDCRVEDAGPTDSGYRFTYSYLVRGTPGEPDEVRALDTKWGSAYYSCHATHALYVRFSGHLIGPYPNRVFEPDPESPNEYVCVLLTTPETATEYQSDLGPDQCGASPRAVVGNPIDVGGRNKVQTHIDIAPTATSPLTWVRYYNSGVVWPNPEPQIGRPYGITAPVTTHLGSRWRGSYDRSLATVTVSTPDGDAPALRLFRHTGERIDYVDHGDRYESVVDPRGLLRREGTGWTYRTPLGELETYDSQGKLARLEGASGHRIDFIYSDAATPPDVAPVPGLLLKATDQHGRHLSFGYDPEGRIASVQPNDGTAITYAYSETDEGGRQADLTKVTYTDGASIEYRYNETEHTLLPMPHYLTGIIDEHGQRFATYTYAAFGHAQTSEHALGAGKVMMLDMVDPASTKVLGPTYAIHTYRFATVRGAKRLVGVDQPGGAGCGAASSSIEYADDGTVSSRTAFDGTITRYRHDADGNEIERIEAADTPKARRVTTEWHPDLQRPVRIAAPGSEETLAYDARGNVTERRIAGALDPSDPSAMPGVTRTWTATYNPAGQLVQVEGPRSDSTTPQRLIHHTYRASDDSGCATGGPCAYRQGDLWKTENALGQVEEILAYDADGRVLRRRDANGVTTAYTYTPRGWLETETITDAQSVAAVTRFDYTASGQVARITDPDGVSTSFEYDAAQRLVGITDAAGNHVRYTLDAAGQRTAEETKDSNGTLVRQLARSYDALGRIESETDAYHHTTLHTYDTMHRWTGATDARGTRSSASYDALGRLRETIGDIDGVQARVTTDHDPLDQLISLTDPKGLTTAYLKTGLGDLSYLDSPDTGTTWREHDAAGALAAQESAGGIGSHRITRDALGRPLTTTFADASLTVTFTYDVTDSRCPATERYPVGRRSSMTDSSGRTAYCYDAIGRVTRKIQTTGGRDLTVAYRYTRAGRLDGATLPDGSTVTWRRDAAGQVASVDVAPQGAGTAPLLTDVTWNALGATGWSYGNGRRLARTYNTNGRPTGVTDMAPGGLRHTMRYDETGQIVWLDTGAASRVYTYDGLGRLTATRDGSSNSVLQQYTYDATGNRTSITVGGATDHYVYATGSHHLTTADGQLRRYDAAGNTIAIGALEPIHDVTGQLASIRQASITLATYRYNGDGQRVSRIEGSGTTHTIYDEAGHWLGDYDTNGRAIAQAIWLGDYPVGLIVDGRVLYIEPDHLGAPRAVIDPVRNIAVWQWVLEGEAFGADLPNEDPDEDGTKFALDLRFPGQRYDAISGLHYNYYRYFDPVSGRYIQSDPIGLAGGLSTYAYVGSNPYTQIDPKGLDFAIVIDNNTVPVGLPGNKAYAGHAAFLVGTNEKGWTYYSKDGPDSAGVQQYTKGDYASIDSFMRSMEGRYKSGVVIKTNAIQDHDARRWADAHYTDSYNWATNNCADLVYGAMDAAGINGNAPRFRPSTPNTIINRMDFSGGKIESTMINNPYWNPGIYGHRYK